MYPELRDAVLVVSGKLVCIELAYRAALHKALYSHIGVASNPRIAKVLILNREGCVRQFLNTVAVVREVEGCSPLPVIVLYGYGVNGKLYASVGDVAHIGRHSAIGIAVGRHGIIVDKVGCALVVILDSTRKA